MFGRTMLHAIAYPEEDSPQFEYKGTAFTCMEAALGPDVNANLLRIKEWWELYGFEIARMQVISKTPPHLHLVLKNPSCEKCLISRKLHQ